MNYKENVNEQGNKKDSGHQTKSSNKYHVHVQGNKEEQKNNVAPNATEHIDESTKVDCEDDDLDDFFATL